MVFSIYFAAHCNKSGRMLKSENENVVTANIKVTVLSFYGVCHITNKHTVKHSH